MGNVSLRLVWIVAVVALAAPSAVRAQATDPSLLVLDPVGLDPASAQQVVSALEEVGRVGTYRVVRPGEGSVIGALSPATGADLLGIVQRTQLHRAAAVWAAPVGAEIDVVVGLASSDGTAQSLHTRTPAASLVSTVSRLFAALLPAPFTAATGAWGTAVVIGQAPPTVASSAAVAPPPSYGAVAAPAPTGAVETPAAPRSRRDRSGLALAVSGGAILGVGWVLNFVVGLFGGYHSCFLSSCSSGFDPAWDTFRATSLVPLIGPWIQLAVKPASSDGWPEWLVADGLLQAAGAVLLFVGIGMGTGDDDAPPVAWVLPTIAPGHVGLMAGGAF